MERKIIIGLITSTEFLKEIEFRFYSKTYKLMKIIGYGLKHVELDQIAT